MANKWLDNYSKEENANNSKVSLPTGFVGEGIINGPQWKSPAWGGQFQGGGSVYPVNYVPQAQDGYQMGTYFDEDARERNPNMMEETYDDYNTGMKGMMKSKMATQAALGNPGARRMMSSMPAKYTFTGEERFSDDTPAGAPVGAPGSHFMANRDNYVFPYLQDNGEGTLNFIPNASPSDREAMIFENAGEADYFANHYKEVAPMMKNYKMQMGGSIPGAVGFTYARTNSPARSNGKHAKKTMASAQNGIGIDNTFVPKPKIGLTADQLIDKKTNEAKSFLNQWMNSPMYNQMIKKSSPDYYNEITKARKENLNRVSSHYNPFQIHSNEAGFSDNNTGNVTILPLGLHNNATVLHELSHGTDSPNSKIDRRVRFIPRADSNLISSYAHNNDTSDTIGFYKYVSDPSETRARLNAIRFNALKNNLYNPLKEKVTPEIYKKLLNSNTEKKETGLDPLNQLKTTYNDDQIINLLNSISQNEEVNKENTVAQNGQEMKFYQEGLDWKPKTISQNGSIIKDDNGYWNPDNWGKDVEINSPHITMEDVYEPLIGISKQTGEKKLMVPGKNYTFANTKQVIEKPLTKKAQSGKELTKLDQLTNFTNYNTKQLGGWMDSL